MSSLSLAVWLVVGLTSIVAGLATWVLAREAWLRWTTRAAVERLERALRSMDPENEPALEEIKALVRRVDESTLERALETMLRSDREGVRPWAIHLFAELGLVERFSKRVREARRWTDRAHAAEILGLAASPEAVPALVAAIRDPHEDASSVKLSAANALAALKDPAAVPLLVRELEVVDEHASPRIADAIVRFGTLALPSLLEVLGTVERGPARVWAARVVGRIGDRSATDALIARLSDRHDMLRLAAAEALGALGDRRALQAVIQTTLRDPAPQVRAHAAAAASKIAGEDAVDVLVAALSDPDYGTRLRALEAFEHIEVHDTAGLERALHDVNPEVKRRAALALERVGFLARIVDELASSDFEVADRAYRDLLKLGSAGLVDSIAGYLHHASFEVRARIAAACGDLAMVRAGPLLVAALDDQAWPVRASLCEAIGRLRVPDAVEALARTLGDESEVVREAAAQALAEYPDDALAKSMARIGAAYGTGTVLVRWHVVGMSARAGGEDAFALLVEASRDPSARVRARSVEALEGRAGAVPALVERLEDPALDVRMAAVSALGSAATEEAFEGLVRALPGAPVDARERIAQALARSAQGGLLDRLCALARSDATDVRLGISWALGKSGDTRAVPTLTQLLSDGDQRVRASAAGALGKIPGSATEKALVGAADDRDPRVRAAIVNALAKTGRDEALGVLEARLTDPDPFVRNRAAIALARVGGAHAVEPLREAERKGLVEDAPASIAWSLVPGDAAMDRLLSVLADVKRFDGIRRIASKEDPAVVDAFHRRLHLEPPASSEIGSVDAAMLVTRYETLLSESHELEGRLVAVEALARLSHDRALDVLGDALAGDPVEAVRLRAARALADRAREDAAQRPLLRAIADPSPSVALVAIRAMAETGHAAAAPALHRRLGLGTSEVSDAVEEAIARIHASDVMGFLDRMMGEDRPSILAASIRVLERIASPVAAPLLVELARSRDAGVRAASVRALAVLGIDEARAEVDAALEDPNEAVRAAALLALAGTRAEGALLRLAALKGDPSPAIRVALATELEGFPGSAGLRLVESLAEDVAPTVRAHAFVTMLARGDAESLAMFARLWPKAALDTRHELRAVERGPRASDRLVAVLENAGDSSSRAIAVSGIAALSAPGWWPRLVPALRDPVPAVRIAAVRALSPVDDATVRARVAELLADPDEGVRDAAKRAQVRLLG